MSSSQSKVYEQILKQIREIIEHDGLKAGDKIPSERELAERLTVGRSSVREAFRALELLGIIETRRGEGTFIKDFKDHHLVDLLGTFILQDTNAKADLLEMNELLEKNAIQLILTKDKCKQIKLLKKKLHSHEFEYREFMAELLTIADNYLLLRVWIVLNEYLKVVVPKLPQTAQKNFDHLTDALLNKNQEEANKAYINLCLKVNID
ncbi:FadR/GntR family transcriptional regulator [Metabacillus arenae]|uniref:FadR family transcriptional regulator n=1 Tax=Metabacillus arenae TaxID=2771434 RepID=A0A926NFZ4_9BACI|nr:GntR family transcriptional regulator [Metabacillus arenae]MBD1380100.1 FadR family transcriptional regulator [Metabacillus arenae]